MPLRPAIRVLLDHAEQLREHIEKANLYPSTTTWTAQGQRMIEEESCLRAARVLIEVEAHEDDGLGI